MVKGVYGDMLQECYRACARATCCYEWHWFKNPRLAGENANVVGFNDRVQCYLLEKNGSSGTSGAFKTPYVGDTTTQVANLASYPLSFIGGLCNGTTPVGNDPHFTSAHDTHFDFTGRLDKSFCLFSDRRFHVNMHLNGYQGSPPVLPLSAKSSESITELNTWIKELGVVWITLDDANRTLRMVACKGNRQEHQESSFISLIQIDGLPAIPPPVGESITTESGWWLPKSKRIKRGRSTWISFGCTWRGWGNWTCVRVAHSLLQTPTEVEAHFNVELSNVVISSAVHGVLGQTFRNTPKQLQRAVKYSHLAALLHHPVDVDKAEGKGFLDSEVEDYISSSVVAPDYKYASYGSA
ncbi:unnamed protein product [Closterium sp. Yama58-4]|nr:unnamed protein product [Closterium sp. Yama58-4]